jgi:hypothetical protein
MPLIMRSSAAFSRLMGSFGFLRLLSDGTRSARGWRPPPPSASGSACWFKFIDGGAAGFRVPPGCVETAMWGCGCGAILKALPTPLGSTVALFNPPAFAGPRGIPLIGTFPVPAEPAARANPPCPPCPPRANEAAGGVKTMDNAIAIFSALLDIRKLPL